MERQEVALGGFGGQGIVLAGYIIGQAVSIYDKKNAVLIQDYGPEARGGACRAQVVIEDKSISYPFMENPSVLAVMSQEAYTKYSPSLRNGSPLLIDSTLVKIDHMNGFKVYSIPATAIAREVGKTAVANIVMLGFLTAITKITEPGAMKKAVLASVPKGTEELNLKAFERGYEEGMKQLKANFN
jgi:2-oxoglutarate ferredoxin oxidoreductase subunit gamma